MDVAVIGGGNLGCAIAKALAKRHNVVVTRRNVERIRFLRDIGCEICSDNVKAVRNSDLVILTVKPKDALGVLSELKGCIEDKKLISFVAGLRVGDIKDVVSCKVVRGITNISAEIGSSVTVYYTSDLEGDELYEVETLLDCMGDVIRVEEEFLIDVATVYSSALAFIAKIFQSFVYAGIRMGLSPEMAKRVTAGVFRGASELLSIDDPEEVIRRVATPSGITMEGIAKLMEHRVDHCVMDAMITTLERLRKSHPPHS